VSARRGATDLAGVIALDKPAGITSHDVVDVMRRATGERRIGHAGTLDPMATGLMLLLVGRATRLERYLVGHDKRYEATIQLGSATDTLDADGTIVDVMPVPEEIVRPEVIQALLRTFLGQHEQMPPAYSAIKRDGVPAYRLAREGGTPELEPRPVEVSEAVVRAVDEQAATFDAVFTVSSGTYIRSLARDIGLAGGTLAHLTRLRRTRVGSAEVAGAHSLDDAERLAREGLFAELFLDPLSLLDMPGIEVDPAEVRDGRPLTSRGQGFLHGTAVALTAENLLLGVYRADRERLIAETVFSPGIPR
jgi:tRNA pseudouridine55 synthase